MCELLTLIYLPTNLGVFQSADQLLSPNLCVLFPGPCNVIHDIGHPPTWQGQFGGTKPHWGHRLFEPGMPTHALRVLRTSGKHIFS